MGFEIVLRKNIPQALTKQHSFPRVVWQLGPFCLRLSLADSFYIIIFRILQIYVSTGAHNIERAPFNRILVDQTLRTPDIDINDDQVIGAYYNHRLADQGENIPRILSIDFRFFAHR